MDVTLVHTGTELSGSYTMEGMVCDGQRSGPYSGTVVKGTATHGTLHFHFNVEDFDLHGTCTSGNAARGTYTVALTIEGASDTFWGTWSARRQ